MLISGLIAAAAVGANAATGHPLPALMLAAAIGLGVASWGEGVRAAPIEQCRMCGDWHWKQTGPQCGCGRFEEDTE